MFILFGRVIFLTFSLILLYFPFKTALLSKLFLLLQTKCEENDAFNYLDVFCTDALEKTFYLL